MSFVGQSTVAHGGRGFTQKEQLKVIHGWLWLQFLGVGGNKCNFDFWKKKNLLVL